MSNIYHTYSCIQAMGISRSMLKRKLKTLKKLDSTGDHEYDYFELCFAIFDTELCLIVLDFCESKNDTDR